MSIGLERDGQIVAGVVYNPANDDIFVAEKGQGAYYNNRRIRVAVRRDMAEGLIATGIPPLAGAAIHPRFKAELSSVMTRAGGVRRFGAASLDLAYVAAGRFDGYWERGLKSWDMAAGIILVREAGGYVTDADGGQNFLANGSICTGNEYIQKQLLDLLKKA